MQIEYIEMSTAEQQAVFGCQDRFARMIEKAFSVLIGLRESKVEVKGEDLTGVSNAVSVLHCSRFMTRGRGTPSMTA